MSFGQRCRRMYRLERVLRCLQSRMNLGHLGLQVDSGSWAFTQGDDTDPDQVADWTLRLRGIGAHEHDLSGGPAMCSKL